MSVEVRAIKESEREECIELWRTVWPGENSRAYFSRYFYGDVEWLPYYTQVALADGKLVSAVQVCKRLVACGEFQLTMGGIANVATLPDYRGRGLNTECLKAAVAVMEADAMDFSLLFTGIHDYYARLGYATIGREGVSGAIRSDFKPRETFYSVRPAVEDDLPAIRALYNGYNRQRPIAVQRYEAYWRDWIGAPKSLLSSTFVATDGNGEVVGYLRSGTFNSAKPYNPEEVEVRVIELGTQEQEEARITAALLDAVAAFFQAKGSRRLRLDIADTPAVQNALGSILETTERRTSNSGMVRLLHRDNLLRSFTLPLNDRWNAAGKPNGTLTFATPYGAVRLSAEDEFLCVEATEAAGDALPQAALFGLLFGSLSPKQATDNAALHPLLTALFPPQASVYWGADGF